MRRSHCRCAAAPMHPSRRLRARKTLQFVHAIVTCCGNDARAIRSYQSEEHWGTALRLQSKARSESNASHEDHDRQRCVVSPDQRRRQYSGSDRSMARPIRTRGPAGHAARLPHRPLPDLSGDPRRGAAAATSSRAASRHSGPQALHIATEGPLGFRRAALLRQATGCASPPPITRSFRNTCARGCRSRWCASYALLRWFHGAAQSCMVSTQGVQTELAARGFRNLVRWRRGVDTQLFRPQRKDFLELPRPIAAYVGRVAVEKNVAAFLRMPWSGTKLVIGDGPERQRLQAQYPAGRVRRLSLRRGSGGAPGGRRCAGVSQPHRHLWPGQSRGHGLRRPGGGVSGHGSDRRRAGRRHRRAR